MSVMEIINERYGVVSYVDADKSGKKGYLRFIDEHGTLYMAMYNLTNTNSLQVYQLKENIINE